MQFRTLLVVVGFGVVFVVVGMLAGHDMTLEGTWPGGGCP